MIQQAFLDFVTEKVDKHTKDFHDTFCRVLVEDPSKIECWIRGNLDSWWVFATLETGKYFYYSDPNLTAKKFIEHFKRVFLKLRLV